LRQQQTRTMTRSTTPAAAPATIGIDIALSSLTSATGVSASVGDWALTTVKATDVTPASRLCAPLVPLYVVVSALMVAVLATEVVAISRRMMTEPGKMLTVTSEAATPRRSAVESAISVLTAGVSYVVTEPDTTIS